MIDAIAQSLKDAIGTGSVVALAFAFGGGILTGFSPCVLPFFPALIGYVAKNTAERDRPARQGLVLSLLFVVGFSSVFVLLGSGIAFLGSLFSLANKTWNIIAGLVLIVVGLNFLNIIQLRLVPQINVSTSRLKGRYGAVLLGVLFGLVLTPCATPVVAAILTYAAAKGSTLFGAGLLLAYSLGHGVPLLAAGISTAFLTKATAFQKHRQRIEAASGIVFIGLGFYFIWLA